MLIRQIQHGDAEQLLSLKLQLDSETQFMLLEPGERKTSLKDEQHSIDTILAKGSMIFVAEHDEQLIGYLGATTYTLRRVRHEVTIVIGILCAFTHQGIGTALFTTMEEWARKKRFHRLELTVITENVAGIALYKKRGFEIEGTRRDAYIINNRYVDEFMMAKLI